jgi:hypothetical protein
LWGRSRGSASRPHVNSFIAGIFDVILCINAVQPVWSMSIHVKLVNIELRVDDQSTPPDWFEATPLDYPQTLDLSWPKPPPKGWNNRKNVGQFIWDVINPNQRKWQGGVRFMHHMLTVHQHDPKTLGCVMSSLGRMYHELLQDHARAAFWYQQAALKQQRVFFITRNAAHLSECYWRLGNKQMAVEFLGKLPLTYASIKLWGDMGETKKAEQLALRAVRNGWMANQLYLYLGDAFRTAGNYDRAVYYYRKVMSVSGPSRAS